jgi:S-DNA-T family DNA segregation ATPase FtsK/SpoIIIE
MKRPPRRAAPPLPSGEILLDPPPEIPAPSGKGWTRMLMVLPMGAGAASMGLMMGMNKGGPLTYVAGGMYGVSVLGMIATMVTSTGGPGRREMVEARRQYLRRLSQLRAQVRTAIQSQREAMAYRHPAPTVLWSTALSGRLWERRRADADFGVVRIAVGPQEVATRLVPPQTKPVEELEPLCATALRAFVSTYSVVPDLSVAVALRDFSRVYVRGPEPAAAGLARALLAQLVTFHASEDLLIGLCVADSRRGEWDWAKWLPHAQHPSKLDAIGQVRLFAGSASSLEAILDDVLANRARFDPTMPAGGPHVVIVVDGGSMAGADQLNTDAGVAGVTVLDLSSPAPRLLDDTSIIIDISTDGMVTGTTMEGGVSVGRADTLSVIQAEALVRELAPLRLSAISFADSTRSVAADFGLTDLLELGSPYDFDLARAWAGRSNRDRLRVPIGLSPEGRPIELDLKESAQDGMGPHGLLVGATGSGKSELLRTLVLGLAVTHSPEILNFVLVDFKGGATFQTLDRLPHTSAVITNLEDQLALVDRMLGAMQGELVRRQELLRDAGNYGSQRDYERARAAGVPLAPLPSLLVIVDEFSELLQARPDFIDMFVQIGRVGRSLGVHLLLASQRLEEGRLRGLDAHLSYRIGLRTFSSMDSRAVLGVPDAYELPRAPGHGYLRTGTEGLIRFKAAYVSGPIRQDGAPTTPTSGPVLDPVREFTTYYVMAQRDAAPTEPVALQVETPVGADTLLDVLVRRVEGMGPPAHQVWLPPLDEPPTLGQLLAPLVRSPDRGLSTSDLTTRPPLQAVVGIVDRPFEQRRDPFWIDLSGGGGNVAVVGGPRSGKSNFLRALLGSLALRQTPREVQFYLLDFGGGSLSAFAGLPHAGGVATRREVDRVRRTVAEVYGIMQAREMFFTANGVEGMAAYRRARAEGRYAEDPLGDVFLIVDGWGTLKGEFEDLDPVVSEIASRGLGFGIHLLLSTNRWMDLRPAVRDMMGTKIELRLGESSDSMVNRRAAASVPEQRPGRGLTPDAFHFLTALPRVDASPQVDDLSDAVAQFVALARESWPGAPAPAVRLLPSLLPFEALPAPVRGRLPIGIAESDLQPVELDFDAEPHALLFGDVESGKSSFLRGLAKMIARSYTPDQARVIFIDYRRSLLGTLGEPHLIGYGTSQQSTVDVVNQVIVALQQRLPPPGINPEQLRRRDWWSGPEVYVLVDDYDLVATAVNPLAPLLDYLPQARDLGLHVVVTRRIGGASRAMFDPVIARIRELASPGIMLSGPREEGALFGTVRAQPLPPGRGWLQTRRLGARLVQLAWTPPAE